MAVPSRAICEIAPLALLNTTLKRSFWTMIVLSSCSSFILPNDFGDVLAPMAHIGSLNCCVATV